jgi:predicted nucleic acid-binding protein
VKVIDAGVIVGLLVGDLKPAALGDEELVAPHLIDSEVTHILRRLVHQGNITDNAATAAMDGFVRLSLTRFPADWLRGRMWALRHNLSAYDATYVALTEMLSATSLLTTDSRLAAARGVQCAVEVL